MPPSNPPTAAFDNESYIALQREAITERAARFGNKLYLEIGGKLLQDLHAARILPGFEPDVKLRMLRGLKEQIDVLVCVFAGDIEHQRYRADFGTTYANEVLKLIDSVRALVMTRYEPRMRAATNFGEKLERRGIPVVLHGATVGYPDDVERILSEEGYGMNPFIETDRPIVAVIAPGPSSGKLATCLTQLYHEHRRGLRAGYAKYETFPVWNLPIGHPVNVAYEAATADIHDFNQIDPFHLEAYQRTAINYNRDVAAFPILRSLLERVTGDATYRSPTDMGVNRIGEAIRDDAAVCEAARQEVVRRMFQAATEHAMGRTEAHVVQRLKGLMSNLGLKESDRAVVAPARQAAIEARAGGKGFRGICCGAAIRLRDGTVVTGKNSPLLYAASSLILNALKQLAGIPDWIHLLPENVTQSVTELKGSTLGQSASNLNVEELLIALAISGLYSNAAQKAIEKLPELKDCEVHMTHITTAADEAGLRRLGVRLTTDPAYPTKELFVP